MPRNRCQVRVHENVSVPLSYRSHGPSPGSFAQWLLKAIPSQRAIRHRGLKPLIEKVHIQSRKTYGSRRITAELQEQGHEVGRDQVSRLRKEMGLFCVQKKKFKATTNSDHDLPVAPNLLDQDFSTQGAGEVWGADITYISTDEGWLYLASVKEEVVGQAMGPRITKGLVLDALEKALKYRRPLPGCIMHTDRGSQYCSVDYQKMVKAAGMRPSMSRRGNCYDNAPTESLWSTLKMALVYQRKFATRMEAEAAIKEYVEIFYNRIRRHSAIGNVAPAVFAQKYLTKRRAA